MKPSIREYLNAFQFLQDYYSFRKSQETLFSYARWSQELGIKNKSYVRFVALGKRPIGLKIMEKFMQNIGFDDQEKKIFEILCFYSQSKTDEQRKALGKELIRLIRTQPDQEVLEIYHEMMMNPLTLVIRTLLTFKDLKKDAAQLAELLGVSLQATQDSIDILKKLEFIEEVDGQLISRQQNLRLPDNFNGSLGLEDFYRKSFQAATQAIHSAVDTRRYRSWFLAFTEEEFQNFSKEAEAQVREKVLEYDVDHFKNRRLYQVLMSTVPVT